MTAVFLQLCNAGIAATWVVLAVLVLRLCLKKAPKWINCVLWGVVGLRLVLPFSIKSALSLIPSAEVLPQDIASTQTPVIHSGIVPVDKAVNPMIMEDPVPLGTMQAVLEILTVVWLAGMAVMALYAAISSLGLYRSVRASVRYRDNIYFCDDVESPFILGVFLPRVYLPSGLSGAQMAAVIAHESAHLKRRDHWWKPLGYLLLMVYWFNPAVWVAYILLCRDIELACDEKVIKTMDAGAKKAYSQALLECSCNRRSVLACPLAFGEVSVKDRIKAVLHYKKPAAWLIGGAVVAVAVLTVCFLTDPKPCDHTYDKTITRPATCQKAGVETLICRDCADVCTSPLEKLSHSYGEAVITLTATCAAQGEKQYICTDCGDTRKETIPMEPHNIVSSYVAKEPTCTATGEKRGQCQDCDQDCLVETIPTNDVHDMKVTVIKVATCTDTGEGENTCTRCGVTETVTYEMLGHSYKDDMILPATCSSEGEKQQTCTVCGKQRWLTVPADPENHRFWMPTMYGGRKCMDCGASEGQTSSGSRSVLDGTVYQKEETSQFPVVVWDPEPIVELPRPGAGRTKEDLPLGLGGCCGIRC